MGTMMIAPPAVGTYLGAYPDLDGIPSAVTAARLLAFSKLSGRDMRFVVFRAPWDHPFPLASAQIVQTNGSIPLLQWEPWAANPETGEYEENKGPGAFSLEGIIAGAFDTYIAKFADDAKTFANPIFIVFADEMNGDWFPWSAKFNGGPVFGPPKFVNAWTHVVDVVRGQGADDITWVWQTAGDLNATLYFPPTTHVDWVGASAYGKQSPADPWKNFDEVMAPIDALFTKIDPAGLLPQMLVEWGAAEDPTDATLKPQFITDGFTLLQTKYACVRAAAWWHEDFDGVQLRIDSSKDSLAAYTAGAGDPFFVDV
jgi:hypothetical protein